MSNRERSRRVRRDIGLIKVGRWTRRAVAAGVVFSGVLGAGLAHLLPGQAAVVSHDSPPAASPEETSPSDPATTDPATTEAPRRHHPRHHPRRLAPPSVAPSPTQDSTQATSGGS